MYFPYLRGKQYELIALRELAESLGEHGVIHPIIEPVRDSTATFRITSQVLQEHEAKFTAVINPMVGDFSSEKDNDLDHESLVGIINEFIDDYNCFYAGILLTSSTDFSHINNLLSDLQGDYSLKLIHLGRIPDIDELGNFVDENNVTHNLFREQRIIRRYRRIIENDSKVILDDPFNEQRTNADYADDTDEFFTDEHIYYEEDGFAGFADYLTLGESYSDSGFAPHAVAIHLTYEENNGEIWIHHFVSDSNEDYTDVAGTFGEALEKLIEFIDENNIESEACDEFREHDRDNHYPGLGSVVKLSVKHHIELVTDILIR
jgi:hypothetical protein